MQHKIIFQIVYAEATSIPYDRTRIQKARSALYRLANLYGIPVRELTARVKENRQNIRTAADKLAASGDLDAAVATMGTIGTVLGDLAGHVHAPVEETNVPQLTYDLFNFLTVLSVLDKLPTAKAA